MFFAQLSIPSNTTNVAIVIPFRQQTDKSSVAIANDFSSIMNGVADKFHTTIICEDRPVDNTLPSPDFEKISALLNLPEPNNRECVTQIARAYDYEEEWVTPALCLLRKRYTKPNELPRIPISEMLVSLQNIQKLYRPFHSDNDEKLTKRVHVIDSNIIEQLDKKPIRVSALSPTAQRFFWDFATRGMPGMFLQPLEQVTGRISACYEDRVVFKTFSYNTFTYPGFEGVFTNFRGKPITSHVSISNVFVTGEGGGISLLAPNEITESKNAQVLIAKFIADDPVTKAKPLPPLPPLAEWRTLNDEVAELNKNWKDIAPLTVEKAIAAKPISIFGTAYTASSAIPDAIAKLYDLRYGRWRDSKNAPLELRIMTHAIRVPLSNDDISDLTWQQIPLPLRRCFLLDDSGKRVTTWSEVQSKKARSIYIEGMKRLRPVVDEALIKSNNQPVPLSSVTSEAKDWITITSVATLMQPLHILSSPLPIPLRNFSDSTVMLHIKDDPGNPNHTLMSFSLEYKNGKVVDGMSAWTQEPNSE